MNLQLIRGARRGGVAFWCAAASGAIVPLPVAAQEAAPLQPSVISQGGRETCSPRADDADGARISRLLGDHYVTAVFVTREEAAVRAGFHRDFRLFVLTDAGLLVVTLDEWLERLGLDGTPTPRRYEHRVTLLDCQQDAALARVDLWEDGRHRYVDFFSLYRFPDGWRIVSKTFQSPT